MPTPFATDAARCRVTQWGWAAVSVARRLDVVREVRHLLVERRSALTAAVAADVRRGPAEVTATDLLPTASACKFLLTDAVKLLRPHRVTGTPLWLWGCRDTLHRRPRGVVGLIGTWNYPVFLTTVPLLQALVAGNGVLWKPSEQTPATADVLADLLARAGVPDGLVVRLPGTREAGPQLAEADIDFVHFTGSDATGRKLAARLGERLIPSTLELSGVDAVIVRADADVPLAARSAWYGATLNAGQTCMATRRALVASGVYGEFVAALRPLVAAARPVVLQTADQTDRAERALGEAVEAGCEVIRSTAAGSGFRPAVVLGPDRSAAVAADPLFAPVLAVADAGPDGGIGHNGRFGLTAAIFTRDWAGARALAAGLYAGCVVVNDVIVPTAHPGTPFGGRGASGWGVTQGADGLLGMTVPQVVSERRGTFRPHVDAALTPTPAAGAMVEGLLRMTHGRGWRERWRGVRQVVGAGRAE